jgi:hypothetical protein
MRAVAGGCWSWMCTVGHEALLSAPGPISLVPFSSNSCSHGRAGSKLLGVPIKIDCSSKDKKFLSAINNRIAPIMQIKRCRSFLSLLLLNKWVDPCPGRSRRIPFTAILR